MRIRGVLIQNIDTPGPVSTASQPRILIPLDQSALHLIPEYTIIIIIIKRQRYPCHRP
jgi:hypothetical protein